MEIESIRNLLRRHQDRLQAEREMIVRHWEELGKAVSQIDRDIVTINREIVTIANRKQPPSPKVPAERYREVREDVFRTLMQHQPATAGEIQEHLGFARSDKRATQSIRNALSALKKEGVSFRKNGACIGHSRKSTAWNG